MRAFVAQTRIELPLSLRQGEQLLVSIVIPLLLLVFFSLVDVLPTPDGVDRRRSTSSPRASSPWPSCRRAMVSLGIGTGFERQYGVLKRLGATPLGRPPAGSAPRSRWSCVLELIQVVVLVADRPRPGLGPGRHARRSCRPGLRARHRRLRRASACCWPAPCGARSPWPLANGLYLVLLLLGGMIIPLSEMPSGLAAVGELLPGRRPQHGDAELPARRRTRRRRARGSVLAVWAVAMPVAAIRLFRWE